MIYIYIIFVIFLRDEKLALYIELIFLGMNTIRIRKIKLKKNIYLFWSTFLIIYLTFTLINSIYFANSFKVYIYMIRMLLLGNILIQVIEDKQEIQIYNKAIIIAGYFMIIFVLFQTPLSKLLTGRFGGKIINPNEVAMKLCVSGIFYLQSILTRKIKIKDLVFFIILVFFIFLTGSRKGLALIFLGTILEIFFIRYSNKLKLIYDIFKYLPLILIGGIFFIRKIELGEILIIKRFFAMFSEEKDGSTLERIDMMKVGIKLFKEKIFMGYGLDSYKIISGFKAYAHNNYVELLVGIGVIGCVIYYFIYFYIIIKNKKYYKKNKEIIPFFIMSLIFPILDIGLVKYNDNFYNIIIVLNFILFLKIRRERINYYREL